MMFKIGEFSKIARVSGRLLRYYDQIGLFRPAEIDPETGYRYYSAGQLPRLNRILALRELGFTLEQIMRVMQSTPSVDELRGMLTMKKAEVEQALEAELRRIRAIEARLKHIEREGNLPDADVIIKSIPPQQMLSMRATFPTLADCVQVVDEMARMLPARTGGNSPLGSMVGVLHSEAFETEDIDLELGFLLKGDAVHPVKLAGGYQLAARELPGHEQVATLVTRETFECSYIAYNLLGAWIEANRYRLAGQIREVVLQMVSHDSPDGWLREFQAPIERV